MGCLNGIKRKGKRKEGCKNTQTINIRFLYFNLFILDFFFVSCIFCILFIPWICGLMISSTSLLEFLPSFLFTSFFSFFYSNTFDIIIFFHRSSDLSAMTRKAKEGLFLHYSSITNHDFLVL